MGLTEFEFELCLSRLGQHSTCRRAGMPPASRNLVTTAAAAALEAAVMTASGAGSEAMSACTIITPSVAARFVPHCGKSCSICSVSLPARNAKLVSAAGNFNPQQMLCINSRQTIKPSVSMCRLLALRVATDCKADQNSMKGRKKGSRGQDAAEFTSSCSRTLTRGLQFHSLVALSTLGRESSYKAEAFNAPAGTCSRLHAAL